MILKIPGTERIWFGEGLRYVTHETFTNAGQEENFYSFPYLPQVARKTEQGNMVFVLEVCVQVPMSASMLLKVSQ